MILSKRHLAKSLSWRIIGTLDTFIFAYLLTGEFDYGLNISMVTTVSKLIWYYIHERLWFYSNFKNSNKRHLIKTFSWRVFGTLDTLVFSWILTGDALIGMKISSVEFLSKMVLYFAHEKLWYRFNFGLNIRKNE